MTGFDPSDLIRGLWSSLAGVTDLPAQSRNGTGVNSSLSWDTLLAKERAKLCLNLSTFDTLPSKVTRTSITPFAEMLGGSYPVLPSVSLVESILRAISWSSTQTVTDSDEGRTNERQDSSISKADGRSPISPNPVKGNKDLVPSQFDPSLSIREANAACGPAAAVALARAAGRNPSLRQAVELAKTVGWTPEGGMNGVSNQKRLLEKLGVRVKMDTSGDWNRIIKLASGGTPVTISTPGHYFVADAYDPQTGRFHVGASGTAYRNGKEWMTRQEIERLAGPLNGTLIVDNKREWTV